MQGNAPFIGFAALVEDYEVAHHIQAAFDYNSRFLPEALHE